MVNLGGYTIFREEKSMKRPIGKWKWCVEWLTLALAMFSS